MTEGADNSGIIYVLTNPAMPDIVKIGKTTDIEQRIKDLSRPTGVPLPFDCVRAVKVDNMNQAETALHRAFGPNRVNPNPRKEFFKIEPEQAIAILELIGTEDVTPGQDDLEDVDVLEQAASDRFKKQTRRPSMRFDDFSIPVGAELKFTRNGEISTVADGGTIVKYEEEEYPISALTPILLGWSSSYVSPLDYWEYEGKLLREISDQVHGIG